VTLTLTLDRVIQHTVMHQSSTSIYIPNVVEIRKTFLDGRIDVPTDGWTFPPLMLLGRLGSVDLKNLTAHYRFYDNVIYKSMFYLLAY